MHDSEVLRDFCDASLEHTFEAVHRRVGNGQDPAAYHAYSMLCMFVAGVIFLVVGRHLLRRGRRAACGACHPPTCSYM